MASLTRFVMLWLVLMTGVAPVCAASKAEERAFAAASQAFRDGWWERAERELGAFTVRHPKSENRAEAVLLRAEARIKLHNYAGAIELLQSGAATAGPFADEYAFWLAEAHFQAGNPARAAELYRELIAGFPTSSRLLEAVVAEAAARSQLQEWPRVTEILQRPDGLFQILANASPTQPAAVRGRFLLAEAHLAQSHLPEAGAALGSLTNQNLEAHQAWQRDQISARIQLAGGHAEQALATTTNLAALAAGNPALAADGTALQARILETLGRADDAIARWDLNLAPTVPPERQREALLHVGDLLIAQGRITDAAQTLEKFVAVAATSPAADLAWLSLGELRLRSFVATNAPAQPGENGTAQTNLLPQALLAFDTLLKEFPQSPLAGKAHLGRGWALWLDGRTVESRAAFQAAVEKLPPSYDRAVARFKLADTLAQQKDFAGAMMNYNEVVAAGASDPQVQSNLVERALYQVLQAAREGGDAAEAKTAMSKLLASFPEGSFAEPGLLAFGGPSPTAADPAARRAVLEQFLQATPDSALAAGVRLAVARTYEQERNWPRAAAEYSAWLDAFTNNPARPRAEFFRALATARSDNESGALTLFTNFTAQFPADDLTPLAQRWIADHFWRGDDFVNAELNYQLLFKNHPVSELRFEAQLMAGRAAFARRPEEALSYFTNLTSDVNCPADIQAQALFASGDTFMAMAIQPAETNLSRGNFKEAARRFSKVAQLYPDKKIAVLALGKVGDCYWQLGETDPGQYHYAADAYQSVLTNALAGIPERSQAEVGLGLVQEKLGQLASGTNAAALTKQALEHFLNVVYGSNRRESEQPDAFWVKRAGLDALRVAEALQSWDHLAKLCDTLSELLPPLQPMLEKKKARAAEQAGRAAN
jgi:TolA-binding protein